MRSVPVFISKNIDFSNSNIGRAKTLRKDVQMEEHFCICEYK